MNNALRTWLLTFAAMVILVVVCVAYIDRPTAEFLEKHIRHTDIWVWIRRVLAPFNLVIVAALFFLLGCGLRVISGHRLPSWTQTLMLCSWAAMWALAAETIFKRIFGRAWVDPTYIQDHLYGFHLFHGGTHWESFPSGTASVSSAIVAVLWSEAPRLKIIGAVMVLLLCVWVVINNFHWVSDVIAGAFLGALIGRSAVHLLNPPQRIMSR